MLEISISIPDDKIEELKEYFFYIAPIPLDKEGQPLYSQLQWLKEWLRTTLIQAYKAGKKKKILTELDFEYEL